MSAVRSIRSAARFRGFAASAMAPKTAPKRSFKRFNSTTATPPPPPPASSNTLLYAVLGAAAVAGGYYYYSSSGGKAATAGITAATAGYEDYKKVYDAIAKKLEDETDYDDGSYGPVLVRLAWHASGTYQKSDNTGGSRSGTMRFEKEYGTDSNAGLVNGEKFLEGISKQFPWISHGDLFTLGGVCAVQQLGGPTVPWRAGRVDTDVKTVPPDGRLPDATKGADHVRFIFGRMGFNDQQMVALIGAHALGRCHPNFSGFDGPWTFSPTVFTNDFYKLLLDEKWQHKKWDGPVQWEDTKTKSLMMLPTDYVLVQDKSFKKWVKIYAEDNDRFFKDFADVFSQLLELGVKFKDGTEVYKFPVWESE